MDKHPHASVIERIGEPAIRAHFNISRQSVWYWRTKGIPKMYHSSVRMLAGLRNVSAKELDA
jgi:hypothetical protein